MTVVRARNKRQRRNRGSVGSYSDAVGAQPLYTPPKVPIRTRGIKRKPRPVGTGPITPMQESVLDRLTDDPQRTLEIAAALDRSRDAVYGALVALWNRGLATKCADARWVRAA